MTLSPEQLEQRLDGITGTDVGAICGVNPWKSALQVYLEKVGEAEPFEGNIKTKWGNLLEPVIREDYAESHGLRVEVPGTLVHPKVSWWMGSPDGIAYRWGEAEPSHGLEIKVHGRDAIMSGALVYGEPGTDQIPPHELIQDAWYMGVTGLTRWDHVAFLDGSPVEYVIDRDNDLLEALRERAERFLVDHVRKRVPPEPDGSKSYDKWLNARWKKNSDKLVELKPDDPMFATILELKEVRAELMKYETREATLEQTIKVAIGDGSGFSWREPGEKKPRNITWRRNKDGISIDWPGVCAHLRSIAQLVISARGGEYAAAIATLTGPTRETSLLLSTAQIVDLLSTAIKALTEISAGVEAGYTKPTAGKRPFLVPRSWKRDADNNQEG